MLSNASTASAGMQSALPKAASVRPVAHPAMRITGARQTKARALLLPREQHQINPIKALVDVVIDWLEPKADVLSSTDESVPEYFMDVHEGHAGWGHSHIADRLATESTISQDFDV